MTASLTSTRAVATPNASVPVTRVHLSGLDGLRAVAVLAVMVFHFTPIAAPGGYIGVDVFFVISGFLITGLLLREHTSRGRISLRQFWMRRARRLLPALVLVVAVCSAAAFFVGGDVIVGLGVQILGAATFSSNWIYIAQGTSYFDGTTPELFRNLWSLAVEEQFYLVWPLLLVALLLLRKRRTRIAIVLAIAAASAAAMAVLAPASGDATRVYYGTDTHAFGLALGAALAMLLSARFSPGSVAPPRRWLAWAGAVAVGGIVLLAVAMPAEDPFVTRGGLVLVALLTVVAIAGATEAGSWLGRSLDAAPLRWIGERSYGLYLWHWPVLILVAATLPRDAAWWTAPVLALAITTLAAALSYSFVELPIRRSGVRAYVADRRRTVAGSIGLLAAFALAVSAVALDPGKTSAQIAIEEGAAAVAAATARAQEAAATTDPAPDEPDLVTGDQVYAIGDSVMLAAAPWLQERLPGIAIDAEVSRSMFVAPSLVQAAVDAGTMRPILVLGLATNGDVDPDDLAEVLDILGPDRLLVVVNGQAPRDWIPIGNQVVADFARSEREVELADWHGAIAPNIHELASDEVHPGGPISGGIYVDSVMDALQRLSELPAPLDEVYDPSVNRVI
ncbi:peptidoglycan/LPS O-acetylase OafA/YrhL [Microbacteriaceae bacterium SG_E_30_P1]|uniref:Peptidoglycan/LPS O-acetylase OafA/YrhL n=1 Tax=Antiquaquibacter oligotrophicus TaxID=2880260 RepID=A0ABT6KLE9_9MICO|nr:acyltransferase family protein [Antiquaquibacter oligotrophicus]MDH6179937.1 peptidoglycan/LPS O-acetylase OafA/YrhL [Antiquaquibacter oligotrophicus]UDF14303.1 acyltransferase [Antiquaquibacter oligotrophicus]